MSKIAFIGDRISVPALAASIVDRDGVEAMVAVVRVDGCWECCWSSQIDGGSLSMAAMKLLYDVQRFLHGYERSGWTPPEDGEVP